MRLVAFNIDGEHRLGLKKGNEVIDLTVAAPHLPKSLDLILEEGLETLNEISTLELNENESARLDSRSLHYEPLIKRSPKIICIGRNYAAHALEGGAEPPTYPEIFFRGAESLIGHKQPIVRPQCSEKLDYEGEIAAVVGREARHVNESNGLHYIAGYCLFNDATIRDYQRKSSQWTIGKNFDGTGAIGPEFVSADELPLGMHGVRIQTRLNGKVMQDANTKDLIFPVAQLVAILSECMTLMPGDIIVTGTPSGVGYVRNPLVFMEPGDICEVEAEGLGVLRNQVIDETI